MHSKYLSFDIGLKHTGVATNSGGVAYPLTTLETVSYDTQLKEISLLINQQQPQLVLFGLPSRGVARERVEQLISDLKQHYNQPIITQDETLSTMRAQALMRQANAGPKKRRIREHSVVASSLLQDYLDGLG